ncbi:hypothetical protein LTR94_023676 [Friedmanniomyces endolithicus]|nr:hypothetical protein LTR94_023676 [Friedmanniomyces endolithicus]
MKKTAKTIDIAANTFAHVVIDPVISRWLRPIQPGGNALQTSALAFRSGDTMTVRKISISDAVFEASPGQEADVQQGNVVDQRHGGPVTIGYGRYGADQTIEELIKVDDVMIILAGSITVASEGRVETAGPGEIIYMPKGSSLTISAGAEGATTAYVTYPHWQEAVGD